MNFKKLLIALIVLLVLVVGAFAAYNFFLKEEGGLASKTGQTENGYESSYPDSSSRPQASLKVKLISQGPVLGLTADGNKVKYYNKEKGGVFECNLDGSDLDRTSSVNLEGLLEVLWSPSKTKVITIFEKNHQLEKYYYDYTTGLAGEIDKNIRWVSWSQTEDKIAYQYYNSITEDNNISTANPDGTSWTNLMQTRMKDLIIEWPKSEIISLRTRASGLAQSLVYTIDQTTNDLEKVIAETYGLTILWSPRGDKILFSETNNQGTNLRLKVLNLDDNSINEVSLVTLTEKCAWSQDNQTIFCAVPKNIPSRAILPDDYWKEKIVFSDDFWKIDLNTQQAEQIYSPGGGSEIYNVKEILLSPNENYLFFINRSDGSLYNLEL